MPRRTRHRREALATINVTPLVDIMLVLLIIFMVTTSVAHDALVVNLPHAPAAPAPEPAVTVTLDAQGVLWLNGRQQDEAGLSTAMVPLWGTGEHAVTFQADQAVPYGAVARVIALLQAAGADQLALVTE